MQLTLFKLSKFYFSFFDSKIADREKFRRFALKILLRLKLEILIFAKKKLKNKIAKIETNLSIIRIILKIANNETK